jgi:hypothetical protein
MFNFCAVYNLQIVFSFIISLRTRLQPVRPPLQLITIRRPVTAVVQNRRKGTCSAQSTTISAQATTISAKSTTVSLRDGAQRPDCGPAHCIAGPACSRVWPDRNDAGPVRRDACQDSSYNICGPVTNQAAAGPCYPSYLQLFVSVADVLF